MRIAFFCGSLAPGSNGVGDYTRRLAGECIRLGHTAAAIALSERNWKHPLPHVSEVQYDEDTSIPCFRVSDAVPWSVRDRVTKQWLQNFNPDRGCLQFVPYAFHHKGLPLFLGSHLLKASEVDRWSVMFHELAVGLNLGASMRHRTIGMIQRYLVQNCIRTISPRTVFTQCEFYQATLAAWRIDAQVLPLFGNIPYAPNVDVGLLLPPALRQNREAYIVGGLFGNIESFDILGESVSSLNDLARATGKRLHIIQFGSASSSTHAHLQAVRARIDGIELTVTGSVSVKNASGIIRYVDFGIANTSSYRALKSGSLAAFLDHDVPCVVSTKGWKARRPVHLEFSDPRIVLTGRTEQLTEQLTRPRQPSNRLPKIARMFVSELAREG